MPRPRPRRFGEERFVGLGLDSAWRRGTLAEGRAGAGIAALPGNRALIASGFELSFAAGGVPVLGARSSAERYDGSALAPTGAMGAARVLPLLAPLDDGTVLVVGGGPVGAELYQP